MALDVASCQICGRIANDPKITTTGTGKPIARFTIATNRFVGLADGQTVKKPRFFLCEVKGDGRVKTIEKFLKVGSEILVVGELDQYESIVDGVKITNTKVIVRDFYFGKLKGQSDGK